MRVTVEPCAILGKACPECDLAGIAVYYINIETASCGLIPITMCAACLSTLGATVQHNARLANRVPA